jgi:SAM-dependent methyltransferase
MCKATLHRFLRNNPFYSPLTQGFFYREKMRAIHRVAPDKNLLEILEVGGGKSGLTALLYPEARVANLDLSYEYSRAPCNKKERVSFICGDAIHLPFKNQSFDAVTLFDVLEHMSNHKKAVLEVMRVLRPGGFILVSSPNENWRFPYYGFMESFCPSDTEIMAEWGHVRRGYALAELQELIGLPCLDHANFINPFTVLCHDFAWSNLSFIQREFFCITLSPLTWLGYYLHKPETMGTETASVWQSDDSTIKSIALSDLATHESCVSANHSPS